jgi:hypothetical protein
LRHTAEALAPLAVLALSVRRSYSARASEWLKEATPGMVSVVVSIQMRKMFAEVRKMFSNARHAEQDVRERQASRNF